MSPDVVTIGALPRDAFDAGRPIIATASMVGARIRTKEAADAPDVIGAASAEGLVYAFRFGVIVVLGAHAGAIARVPRPSRRSSTSRPRRTRLKAAPSVWYRGRATGSIPTGRSSWKRSIRRG